MKRIAAIAICAALNAAQAQEMLGDPEAGLRLATAVCSECHRVGDTGPAQRVDGAPAFDEIASDARFSPLGIRVFLRTPHIEMPNLMLSDEEIDDIIAYLAQRRGL